MLSPIDTNIANRIRRKRISLGYSQKQVADRLSITFQQLQKYEKAQNRISGGYLYKISKIFEVPVSFFFEDEDDPSDLPTIDDPKSIAHNREILSLVRAYNNIGEAKVKKNLLTLLHSMGSSDRDQNDAGKDEQV